MSLLHRMSTNGLNDLPVGEARFTPGESRSASSVARLTLRVSRVRTTEPRRRETVDAMNLNRIPLPAVAAVAAVALAAPAGASRPLPESGR